ncbi:MAG: NADH-quinone oxidoreductase subunit NuoE [Deltaproteobacteria bacterium]|nr:NADH-quinone oxidoreductase subunit NuoE [Deltaproteobacteria bacterium]
MQYRGQEGRLIPLLQQAQAEDGFLSRERLERIHEETGVPLTQIYGVATFYAQFRFTPVGKHLVKVCHGTACHVSGAEDISEGVRDEIGIGNGETTADRQFTVEKVSCLGCCSLAPVIMVGETTHGNLTPVSVRKVLKGYAEAGTGTDAGSGTGTGAGGEGDA